MIRLDEEFVVALLGSATSREDAIAKLRQASDTLANYLTRAGFTDQRVRPYIGSVGLDFGDMLLGRLAAFQETLATLEGEVPMGALDDFINGVKKVGGAILGGIDTAIDIGQRIGVFPSAPVQGPVWTAAPSLGGGPGAMMMNGSMAAPGSFQAACAADPTGQCQAAIWAALQGTVAPTMGGVMNEDAMLAALGFPPALIMALKNIPGAVGRLLGSPAGQIAIGVGGGIAGTALGGALIGGGMGMRLPRRIQVPDGRGGVREYVSRGRPVLYSGDITAARRVRKVAARARRTSPRRRSVGQTVIALQAGATHNVCGKCLTSPCAC